MALYSTVPVAVLKQAIALLREQTVFEISLHEYKGNNPSLYLQRLPPDSELLLVLRRG